MGLFASDLLAGATIALAGGVTDPIGAQLQHLGAELEVASAELPTDEHAALAWAQDRPALRALVHDAGPSFAGGGSQRLRAALDGTWIVARAIATGALIPAAAQGRLLFITPRPDVGTHAQAARAALENLARTLSVEWARFGVTAVAITPGSQTTEAELADLLCFLLSDAGGYFSGCRFELGAIAEAGSFISGS